MATSSKDDKASTKTFSFETVAALCCAIMSSGGPVGTEYYALMSALDGKRTVNSFQHEFRDVIKRARELKKELDSGAEIQPVTPKPKGSIGSIASTSTTKKRARVDKEADADAGTGAEMADTDDTPSKSKYFKSENDGDDDVKGQF